MSIVGERDCVCDLIVRMLGGWEVSEEGAGGVRVCNRYLDLWTAGGCRDL